MNSPSTDIEQLLAALPDIPRWIEAREALREVGRAEVLEMQGSSNAVIVVAEHDFAVIIGSPAVAAISNAARQVSELIAFPENHILVGSVVPDWLGELVTLFDLPKMDRLAEAGSGATRMLERGEVDHLDLADPVLREELDDAVRDGATIWVSLENDRPVAFCYDASRSERWWDIGIDTIAEHRGRGHGWRAASAAIRYWDARQMAPRWACGETNVVSRRLARKLGFEPTDAMVIFERLGS